MKNNKAFGVTVVCILLLSLSLVPPLIQAAPGLPITLVPMSLDFGEVTVGEDSDPQEVSVTNSGDADVTISNISIIGPDASEFSQTNNCPGTLSPGASCMVNVTFSPNSEGAKVAGLLIRGSYPSGDGIKIFAVNVALSGTGVVLPPAAVGGEAYPVNKLAVLAPWIVLAVLLVSGMSWFILRRRKA